MKIRNGLIKSYIFARICNISYGDNNFHPVLAAERTFSSSCPRDSIFFGPFGAGLNEQPHSCHWGFRLYWLHIGKLVLTLETADVWPRKGVITLWLQICLELLKGVLWSEERNSPLQSFSFRPASHLLLNPAVYWLSHLWKILYCFVIIFFFECYNCPVKSIGPGYSFNN